MAQSYDELQDSGEPKALGAHSQELGVQLAGDIKPMPLAPAGSIERIGQDVYRREISRDSVTGSFRTRQEAVGLSTTRTSPNK